MHNMAKYPLLDALVHRRSRRFAPGMQLNGGPLAYISTEPPLPLTIEEEAALAFASCGITGYALSELPFQSGAVPDAGGGNIMINFIGRTVASAEAAHMATVFVINDAGAWMLKRPQDHARTDIAMLVQAAREHRLVELYNKSRVQLCAHRVDVPREVPHMLSFNKWSANVPGTTIFVPVMELTALTINVLLSAFSAELGYYVLDDRNGFRPAGIAKFARSNGGHLYDNPKLGRVATLDMAETWLYEFAAVEQGAIFQNLALMTQALGLGGFPFLAAHPHSWMEALGFRLQQIPFARTIGASRSMAALLRLLNRNPPIPTPLGLELGDTVLIKPFCPPYYPSMREAVLAFVDYKCAVGQGTQHDGGATTAWRDAAAIQAGIPRPADKAIEATIACCEYVYNRYGRLPRPSGPFRTVLAYQAHHLDLTFYDRFYQPNTLTERQYEHSPHAYAEPGKSVATPDM